jgi:hypothetical protein
VEYLGKFKTLGLKVELHGGRISSAYHPGISCVCISIVDCCAEYALELFA